MYYRVFGTEATPVSPAALLQHVQTAGFAVTGHFRGDEQGWLRADLVCPVADARIELERFFSTEEGVRAELNSWAAWLETAMPDQPHWLQHLISTRQIFTLQPFTDDAAETSVDELCICLCRYLAVQTGGIYQIDSQGFFEADGRRIVEEPS